MTGVQTCALPISVFIHHFFPRSKKVSDEQLLPLIEKAKKGLNARGWYSALMDYGAFLKSQYPNPSRKSKHHVRQSKFEGSLRQIRGEILRQLHGGPKTKVQINRVIKRRGLDVSRSDAALRGLLKDDLIHIHNKKYFI